MPPKPTKPATTPRAAAAAAAAAAEPSAWDMDPEDSAIIERAECVQDYLDRIMGIVDDYVDQAELTARVIPYAVDAALADSLNVIKMAYTDRTDTWADAPCVTDNWMIDYEPKAAPMDTWARGQVPVKRQVLAPDPRDVPQLQPRGGLFNSIRTGTGRKGSIVGSRGPGSVAGSAKPGRPTSANSLHIRPFGNQKAKAKERLEYAQLEKLHRDLRGREYAYDHKGRVVVLSVADPARLPDMSIMPNVEVKDPSVPVAEPPKSRSTTSYTNRKKEDPEKKRQRLAVAARKAFVADGIAPGTEFVQDHGSRTTMIENMTLSPGVTLREGGSTKTGPPLPPEKAGLTKGQFEAKLEAAEHPGAALYEMDSELQGDSPLWSPTSQGAGLGEVASIKQAIAKPPPGSPKSKAPRLDKGAGGGGGVVAVASAGSDLSQAQMAFERLSSPPDWIVRDASTRKLPAEVAVRPPPKDPNEALISAPDWGSNTSSGTPPPRAAIPSKVTSKQREESLGHKPWSPRDRPQPLPRTWHRQMPPPINTTAKGYGVEGPGSPALDTEISNLKQRNPDVMLPSLNSNSHAR
eukprot:jgi/Mesvir1/1418/Mv14416-RA.2